MKEIWFLGDSLDRIRSFAHSARQRTGYELDRVQQGLNPIDWKPMSSVGKGVKEIRVKVEDGIYRTVYITKLNDQVIVLHAFKKRSQKTSKM